jgi:hypothetical protein
MLSWCIILFGLGVLAFLDTLFNYGEIFRRVNSVLFMLVSLGLLIRIYHMTKLGILKEKPANQNTQLEDEVTDRVEKPVEEKLPVA